MPRSADPQADARLILAALENGGISKGGVMVGLDLALNQREVGAALYGLIEDWFGEFPELLNDMRLLLRALREPAYREKEKA